jgi:hypothetical protein
MNRLRETIGGLGLGFDGKAKGPRIDRDAGVIYGVLVVGKVSRNRKESSKGRRYTDECLREALGLYEGARVRVNHLKINPTVQAGDRDVNAVLGQLRGCWLAPEGVRGNLHYLKSHPMADRLADAAEAMPTAFGLSHDVSKWEGGLDGQGVYTITRIATLEGVDLVDTPGSTRGLFESEYGGIIVAKKKLSETLPAWSDPVKEVVAQLIESDYASPDMMVRGDGDPDDQLADAFANMVWQVVKGAGDRKVKLAKVKAILEAQDKLIEAGNAADAAAEDRTDPDAGMAESLQAATQEVERARLRESIRVLCDAGTLIPTSADLKVLERLDTEAERKNYIRDTAAARRKPAGGGNDPNPPSNDPVDRVRDGKTFAQLLKGELK